MDLAIKLIVLLPLLAAAIAGLFCRIIGDRPAQIVTCAALLIAAALSVFVFIRIGFGPEGAKLVVVKLFTWIDSGTLDVAWSLRVDTLTAVMLIVVTGVSSMVHVYSVGYMAEDPSIPRFMSYLSLFTFFMLMLVTSDNLVQLFFGWEGVGLASYLLIGFWYDRPSANAAAIKAFIVNRVGDFGFALGIFAVWMLSGSVNFAEIFAKAPEMATTSRAAGASSNSGEARQTRNTPAVTMVAAWISAETGVGPSMASGSQVCRPICADFPHAPMKRRMQSVVRMSAS